MKNSNTYKSIKFAFFAKSASQFAFALTIVLVLQKMLISGSYIASAFSLMTLVAVILDIPMGVFADKFSYRSAVLFAGVAEILSFISFLFSSKWVWLVFIGFLFKGISSALESGAFRLLLFDAANLDQIDPELARKQYAHDIQNILRFASLAGVGLGLYILKFSEYYPLLFGLFLASLYTLIISFTKIDHIRERKSTSFKEGFLILREGFKFCISPIQLPLLLYCILEGFRTGTDQPAFAAFAKMAFNGENLLWTLAIISFVVRTPSNILSHKLRMPIEKMILYTPLLFSVVGILFFIMGNFATSNIALVCIVLNFIVYSFRDYWFENWQAHNVSKDPNTPRATALSALSFSQNLFAFFGTQLLAAGGFLNSPQKIYVLCGIIIFIFSISIFIVQILKKNGQIVKKT
jgi:MFS family permease